MESDLEPRFHITDRSEQPDRQIESDLEPRFHIIVHDLRIAENTASDRQQLYGTLFSDRAIVSDYMETLFSDRAIVGDREISYVSVIPAIRRS